MGAMVVAPVLLLASTIAYVVNGNGMNQGELGGVVQVWAFIAFAVAVVALTRRFAEAAPQWSSALLVAGLAGSAAGVGYGIDAIQTAVFGTESLQEVGSAAGSLALQAPGLLFPLSLFAIGILLVRTKTAPGWAAGVLAAGGLLFATSRFPDIEALAIVGDTVLLLALVAIGWDRARAVAVPAAG